MADAAELVIRITGDIDDIERKLDRTTRSASDMGDKFESAGRRMGGVMADFGKVAAVGLGAAAVGVGAFVKSAVDAAEESRKVMAQTNAVIESTGGVANVSAAGVGKLADKLAALSGIDDEVIAGGQNMLLTFTQVRNQVGKGNDVFDQATKAALNMSVALGTDMKGASMLVGKALNDPIAGLTALSRSGIQFTAQQKDQIKAMVAVGDTMGAQKIILKELETQFGGSAEAAASPMARLKVVAGNLQEQLGARLLPVVEKVATFLANKLPGAIDKVTGFFSGLFNLFKNRDFTGEFGKALGVEEDSPIVAKILSFRDKFLGVVNAIVGWVRANWPEIKRIITETMETVRAVIAGVVDVVKTIWDNFGSQIMSVAKGAWEFIKSTILAAMDVIQGIVKIITGVMKGDWGKVWEGIKQVLSGAWDFMIARIEFFLNLAKNIISAGWEIVKGIFSGAWDAIKGAAREAFAWIVDKFLAFGESIITNASRIFGWVPGLGGKLREAADRFEEFRNDVNASLRGINDKVVNVTVRTVGGVPGGTHVGAMAKGGFVNGPTMALIGEAGRELVLPLTNMNRTMQLLNQAGLIQPFPGGGGGGGASWPASTGASSSGTTFDYRAMAEANAESIVRKLVPALAREMVALLRANDGPSDSMHVAREIAWRTGA